MVARILTALAALLAAAVMYSVGLLSGGSALLWSVMTLLLALAAVRPEQALLVVAAFAPLGGALAVVTASRASWAEPLAMAAVTGWLIRRVAIRQSWDPWPTALAAVMAAVVIASIGVQMYVTHDTIASPGLTFGRAVFDWVVHNSQLPAEPSDLQVVAATRLLVGLGLFAMATAIAAAHPALLGAIVRVTTVGIAAVAALSLNRFVELVLRRGESFAATALELQRHVRVSSTIPDLNAASALFVLALPLAVALAWRARARAAWTAAAAVLGAGIWLTGSRAGLLMGVLGLVASVLLGAAQRWTRMRTTLVMGLLVAGIAAAAAWYPRTDAHSASADAWEIRKQLVITGVNMTRERPAWGVGIGRFYPESARFGSPALHRFYLAENAHNQFVQVLGELGLVGVTLFLALVVTAAAPAARWLGTGRADEWQTPLLVGVVALLGASLLMHPLLIPEVSCVFWLSLGLLRGTRQPPLPSPRAAGALCAVVVAAVALMMPVRVAYDRHRLDLDSIGVGLSLWQQDPNDSRRYRVATGPATVYVDAGQRVVRLPLRARGLDAQGTEVGLSLDGRPAGRTHVPTGTWIDLTLMLPDCPTGPKFRRLDLIWTRVGSEATLDIGRAEYPGRSGP